MSLVVKSKKKFYEIVALMFGAGVWGGAEILGLLCFQAPIVAIFCKVSLSDFQLFLEKPIA